MRGHTIESLSKSELEQLRTVFALFDPNKTNKVPVSELRKALLNLAQHTDQSNIYRLITELENREGRELSFDEFASLFSRGSGALLRGGEISRKDSNALFAMVDVENQGKIGFRELKRLTDELHEPISATEIEEMIHRADLDGDGFVDPDEFHRILSHRLRGAG
eukprot:Protomagalhaensia_sp_Gyna_25__291@NODE_1136_length_2148_cov_701_115220_g872_i1_p3_GENE_NODE_1136_length_2148_cov_701_115220_g872_i1NODE_1136_length_2148_cov_701_115220_g872_i1_p3_ORF_typecomplete_len164_score31_11EFhand_7/PF13499_6/1_2e05EFhand_7/PF13499_6/1_4e12EFhand_8/PF13833_6/0_25EFhand_8/PF13833_6/2_1EFhand_8/PF13833_6/0_00017EFhand_8/PF13833_6/7_3e09EFhand_1/PF00036_32/40EFhand_1/PF00036_32/61EFhand_1/PF00036_32/0_21EFhand_1/PF00036_32/9_8e08EFhand_11/PF08976_11/2e07EFhand_11/PF08976_11/0